MKKGQVWSLELSVTIMIFLFALVIFAGLILKKGSNVSNLSSDAEKTMMALSSSSDNAVIENNVLNKTKAGSLNYSQLKRELGLKNDVCIYFEDKNGRLISLSGTNAVGDSSVQVNGQPCANNS